MQERETYTVPEAAQRLGISRGSAYELVRKQVIPSIRLGRRIVIPKVQLHELLATTSHPAELWDEAS